MNKNDFLEKIFKKKLKQNKIATVHTNVHFTLHA